ncbi:putative secreted RxLR effector protein [Phytophthora cinnamomi]|uniref:putative secreted RxLR effector protein n=1 Tax=Phytophthora cinnamomi TaxID=4785 RepID=UPI00355A2208|nr:putative secreted RxLR effector protein [Phytophthora cinnamomi]
MRRTNVAVLVAVIFLAVNSALAARSGFEDISPRALRSLSDKGRDVSSTKTLSRPSKVAVSGGEEERAIAIPSLAKIKEWITTNISRLKRWYSNRKQAQDWMKEEKTPDEIFKLLKLDEDLDTVLDSPKLTTWAVFLVKYNKKHPEKAQTLLGVLTKHYGTLPLAKALETARLNPSGDSFKLANKLQGGQLMGWRWNGLSTDVVFDMLKIGDGSVEKLLSNPALNVWVYYFTRWNRYNPDREVSMIAKLRTTYDDIALAKAIEAAMKEKRSTNAIQILQKAQFKMWLLEGKDPPKIFKMLKIEMTKWPYDPNVDIYRAYKLFYKENNM